MNPSFYYQEITCLPDHEISVGFVMGRVMDIVHLQLVTMSGGTNQCPIGLSFPEYRDGESARKNEPSDSPVKNHPPIGSKIRLFSREENPLVALKLAEQLERLSDYVHLTSVRRLERKISQYAVYKRVQSKSSKERLIRRQMKRKGLSEKEAQGLYSTFEPRHTNLPYVNMRSHSSGENFRLYIARETSDISTEWSFSTYGLSGSVGVPEF